MNKKKESQKLTILTVTLIENVLDAIYRRHNFLSFS